LNNVLIDGIYLSGIGILVVFIVLILLMISIKVITFFDKHSAINVPNISSTNEKQNDKNTLNDIAAAVAVAIYKKTKSKITKNIPMESTIDSSWITVNRSRVLSRKNRKV
jgi:sodium pump decarboxylase gamma subunit|tara:strand:- start:14521 stop:14850 length:330 start_codon:yes stop_codon:yes gene_type:complete